MFNFSYAFQPIIDTQNETVFSYEALLRTMNNESPSSIFSQLNKEDLLEFDLAARLAAITMASQLGIKSYLNLNFMPISLQNDAYIQSTVDAFKKYNLGMHQLVIEITEEDIIQDHVTFALRINQFRAVGIKVAIDDFGAGYSGLNFLVNFQPDMIKLDMQLLRNIHAHGPRQAIVKAIIQVCTSLGIDIIAEGVEIAEEYFWLKKHGIYLFQGYLFAKPGFESLPTINFALWREGEISP